MSGPGADAAALFDRRPAEAAAGSLFGLEELAQLFAIADQASEADREAVRELRR